MDEYGKLVIRIPKGVYARMWVPYCRLPSVEDHFETVNAPHTTHMRVETNAEKLKDFNYLPSNKKMCDHGIITYEDGKTEFIFPREYILYHKSNRKAVGKISEQAYLSEFVESIDFCSSCQVKIDESNSGKKSQSVPPPITKDTPKSSGDILRILADGKTITVPNNADGTNTVISSISDLQDYASKNGLKI